MGLDYSYAAALVEALGEISAAGVLMGIGVQTDIATPARANYGSDELREEYLILDPRRDGRLYGSIRA